MNDVLTFDATVDALRSSSMDVWSGVAEVLPLIVVAIVIIIVGWLIGAALSKVVSQIIKAVKLDRALSAAGVGDLLQKAGFQLNSGHFIGELVKWFVIVVSFIAAFNIVGLDEVTDFLSQVVAGYIPKVISAVVILLIAVVIADVLRKTVVAAAKAADLKAANFLGAITKWAIWIAAAFAALLELEIGIIFVQTLVTPFMFGLALALGLAFGLGGKDAAGRLVERAAREVAERD